MSDKTNKSEELIAQAIMVLSETFSPAMSIADSAKTYTSMQMSQAIADLTGLSVSSDAVYAVMTELGYRYVVDETSTTLRYVWLLKYNV